MSDVKLEIKKCGPRERCFKPGSCWGHFEHELCEHLCEKKDVFVCMLDDKVVSLRRRNSDVKSEMEKKG